MLAGAVAGLFLYQSCSEVGPKINGLNGGDEVASEGDTAYTTSVETPQTKHVLAEEFTGVSCPPCPNGHKIMKSVKEQLNGNLITISYHINNFPQAKPVEKGGVLVSKYDFRTEDATDVGSSIFGGVGAMPLAGFDRTLVSGSNLLNTGNWSATAATRSGDGTPINVYINSAYDETTREATIQVKLAYTELVTLKENLTIAIVEDSIIDAQKTPDTIIKEYVHEHVLRDIITPVVGQPIPPKVEPKEPGRVYEQTLKYTVDEAWHAEHCHIIAFVNRDDATDRHIVQAAEAKLMGGE